MQSRRFKSVDGTRSLALRVDRARERRCALALIVLLGFAPMSVLAAPSALSQQHAATLLTLTSP